MRMATTHDAPFQDAYALCPDYYHSEGRFLRLCALLNADRPADDAWCHPDMQSE